MLWAFYYTYIYIGWVRDLLRYWGDALGGVYLLGDYLQGWLFAASDYVGYIEGQVLSLYNNWRYFEINLNARFDALNSLQNLRYVSEWLISFAYDPRFYIESFLRDYFNPLYLFYNDPIGFIVDQMNTYTGLTRSFVYDPRGMVLMWIDEAVGDVRAILRSPAQWALTWLGSIIKNLDTFKNDPAAWVADRLKEKYPALFDFLRAPVDYIFNIIINQINDAKAENTKKLISAVGILLARIF